MRLRRALAASFGLTVALSVVPALRAEIVVGGRVELAGKIGPERASAELVRVLDPYEKGRRRLQGEPQAIVDRATPDALGLFTLTAPEPGLYQVRVTAPGHLAADRELVPLVEPLELPILRLPAAEPPITLQVLDGNGNPMRAPNVTLVLDPSERIRWPGTTRPWAALRARDGGGVEVQVGAGDPILEISAAGHEPTRLAASRIGDPVRLSRRAGAVERRILVHGRTRAPGGSVPVPGALLAGAEGSPIALGGEDGSVTCWLAPGETVHVLDADERRAVWIADQEVEARIVLEDGPALTGVVFGADGVALRGAWVGASDLNRRNDGPDPLGRVAVETDRNGRYLLPVAAGSELRMWARAAGHLAGWREERSTPGVPPIPADFHLAASSALEGVVVDAAGSPVIGAEIEIDGSSTSGWQHRNRRFGEPTARSRDGGRFAFSSLPPAVPLDLIAKAAGFAPGRTEVPSTSASERQRVVITLDAGSSVRGRVVDAAGSPIAGASVTLDAADPTSDSFVTPSELDPNQVATTDSEGSFALQHLSPRLYELRVQIAGFSTHRRPGVAVPAGGTDLGDVVLTPGLELIGRVENEEGQPIAGAVVVFAGDRRWSNLSRHGAQLLFNRELQAKDGVTSDGEGRFRLTDLSAGQPLDLYVDAEGYDLVQVPRVSVPVEEEIVVRLRRGGSLRGRIVDREGEPQQVGVRVQRGTQAQFVASGERGMILANSQPDGAFSIVDLGPGEWNLEVRTQGFKTVNRVVAIDAGEETVTPDIVLEREETAVVRGLVTDRSGAGVEAHVRYFAGQGMEATQSDATGAYVLAGVPIGSGNLAAQRVAGGGEARQTIEVVEGENRVDFRLDGAMVSGRVVDEEGIGLAGVSLQFNAAFATSASDGGFRILDLAPGRYPWFAFKTGWATRGPMPNWIDVAPEGVTDLELVMTRGAVIRGRILGVPAAELSSVAIQASGFGEATANVLADSTYQVTGVGPGEWTIVAHAGNLRQVRRVVVVSPEDSVAIVDLDFSGPGFMLRGHFTGPEGPLKESLIGIREAGAGIDEMRQFSWTDYQGAFVFGPLAAGSYVIEGYEGRSQTKPIVTRAVTIDDDQEIFLSAPRAP